MVLLEIQGFLEMLSPTVFRLFSTLRFLLKSVGLIFYQKFCQSCMPIVHLEVTKGVLNFSRVIEVIKTTAHRGSNKVIEEKLPEICFLKNIYTFAFKLIKSHIIAYKYESVTFFFLQGNGIILWIICHTASTFDMHKCNL